MAHESFEPRQEVRGSSDRSFGIVFAVVFSIVAVWPLFFGHEFRWWAGVVSVVFVAIALVVPGALSPANKLWTRFGAILHKIVNPVVLGVMFFLVVLPTGLLMKLFRKDPLRMRYDRNAKTYWIEREPARPDRVSLKDQF